MDETEDKAEGKTAQAKQEVGDLCPCTWWFSTAGKAKGASCVAALSVSMESLGS